MNPDLLWIVLIVGTAFALLVLRQRDGRNTGADESTWGGHASRIASQFGLADAAFLLLMLLVHLLPLQKVVQQNHSGSGDNVGRNKVVRRILDALPEERTNPYAFLPQVATSLLALFQQNRISDLWLRDWDLKHLTPSEMCVLKNILLIQCVVWFDAASPFLHSRFGCWADQHFDGHKNELTL